LENSNIIDKDGQCIDFLVNAHPIVYKNSTSNHLYTDEPPTDSTSKPFGTLRNFEFSPGKLDSAFLKVEDIADSKKLEFDSPTTPIVADSIEVSWLHSSSTASIN
jgi:hypothetical protein